MKKVTTTIVEEFDNEDKLVRKTTTQIEEHEVKSNYDIKVKQVKKPWEHPIWWDSTNTNLDK